MNVLKVIEVIGCSSVSWEEAVKSALAEAAKTIQHIKSIYVKEVSANVENNKICEYNAKVKIFFVVDQNL